MNKRKKIAVIGMGSSGLAAVKSCLESGLQVTGYEQTEDLGGLWRFRESVVDGEASVMKSTVINSSKEMSAYSDFPSPPDFPNFMHNTKLFKYFGLYAEKFDLLKHIRLNHKILQIRQNDDYENTGRWQIKVRDILKNEDLEDVVDGVMICTGHHAHPKMPSFPGMDDFRGEIIHSHSYRVPEGYENKNVLVVGIGNSGVDVAVELGTIAKTVYLSTRRGAWVIPRRGIAGKPVDFAINNRISNALLQLFPTSFSLMWEAFANFHFSHKLYDVKPKHHIINQHPTLSDLLCVRVLSGTVVLKDNIKRFTKNGVFFVGDVDKEYAIDAVVFATGYFVKFPFLDDDIVSFGEDHLDLYKLMFPPQLKHSSLAFIGMIQPIGSIIPISELQSRWFAQLILGNVRLPAKNVMLKDIEDRNRHNREKFYGGWRHVMEVLYVPYMDDLASQIGAKPNLSKMMFTDFRLFWNCFFGPCVPYQYRLVGPHSWSGAREAVITVNNRMRKALKTREVKDDVQMGRTWNQMTLAGLLTLAIFTALLFYSFSVF